MATKLHKKKFNAYTITTGLLSYIILISSILIFFLSPHKASSNTTSNETYAKNIVATCTKSKYHPTCYDNEIPKLMDRISLDDAFAITHIIQQLDPTYAYCHSLGHKVASMEVAKDRTHWQDVYRSCPLNTCANGCQHGVLQEVFRAEYLSDKQIEAAKPALKNLCEVSNDGGAPTEYEKLNCYHGLGHMTIFMTEANVNKSLDLCDDLSVKPNGDDNRIVCYDGLFMQIFQPQEIEDISLVKKVKPQKKDLLKFCEQFSTDLRKEICWHQGWIYFKDELSTPKGILAFCGIDKPFIDKARCYDIAFHGVAQVHNFDTNFAVQLCNSMPVDLQGKCYSAHISAMFNAEKTLIAPAVHLCAFATSPEVQNECYDGVTLQAGINFHKNSPEFAEACSLLPGNKKTQCLTQT